MRELRQKGGERERGGNGGWKVLGFVHESDEIKGWRDKGEGDTWSYEEMEIRVSIWF